MVDVTSKTMSPGPLALKALTELATQGLAKVDRVAVCVEEGKENVTVSTSEGSRKERSSILAHRLKSKGVGGTSDVGRDARRVKVESS